MQRTNFKAYRLFVAAVRVALLLLVSFLSIYIFNNFFSHSAHEDYVKPQLSVKSAAIESYASKPEFLGQDQDNQVYKIQAEKGLQKEGKVFELENITTTYNLKDNEALIMNADKAEYNLDNKVLHVYGNIHAFHGKGFTLGVHDVHWDLATKSLRGEGDVKVTADFGEINADNFAISESYSKLEFYNNSGRVKVTGVALVVGDAFG